MTDNERARREFQYYLLFRDVEGRSLNEARLLTDAESRATMGYGQAPRVPRLWAQVRSESDQEGPNR
jgi:hypothetical protein